MKKKGNKKELKNSKVIGIIALKGGVGKTTVVSNLGAVLASKFKKKVLMIDANFSTPHLGLHIGLLNPDNTLQAILNNECKVGESIYIHNEGFHIIPGQLMPKIVDPLLLKRKIAPLKKIYDLILIDSSPSLDNEILATIVASDELLVVSTPDYPTLSSTLHAVKIAHNKKIPIKGIVLNRVNKKSFELTKKDISDTSDIKVLISLPENLKVQSAISKMVPVVIHYPRANISHSYKKLASMIVN